MVKDIQSRTVIFFLVTCTIYRIYYQTDKSKKNKLELVYISLHVMVCNKTKTKNLSFENNSAPRKANIV